MTTSGYTIQQVADLTDLTVHTLRYYERIGLLLPVDRAGNGHRRYSDEDLRRIEMLNRLRRTGMPLADMMNYFQLLNEGTHTVAERCRMLEDHRRRIMDDMKLLEETLAVIDYKIQNYTELEAKHQQCGSKP